MSQLDAQQADVPFNLNLQAFGRLILSEHGSSGAPSRHSPKDRELPWEGSKGVAHGLRN